MTGFDHGFCVISVCYIGASSREAKARRRKKSKGEGSCSMFRKRKLTNEQVNMLELNFVNEHKLDSERKDRIASELGLDPRQVEDEYTKLKNEHDNTVVEKCQLQNELDVYAVPFNFSCQLFSKLYYDPRYIHIIYNSLRIQG
ncbi:hypothetical protein DCAR_0312409 [Daucus carota subsp. sativus]|uniref:Homeobox-leucine zipper protein n=1 Tax=Daucus carota subsp. sativus TaxID=79200 RepID=A0AAF0WRG0_DAUCS|nr:hypothetical protein DCAR_0312409 [Daucus carota subsp. sativus]